MYPPEWLRSRITITPDGHWLWKKAQQGKKGYGRYDGRKRVKGQVLSGKVWLAHRYVWIELFGLPDCENLHHTCPFKLCVNPACLRPLTLVEHQLEHHWKSHCSEGHELDEANAYYRKDGNGRQCRKCKARRERERQARIRQRYPV